MNDSFLHFCAAEFHCHLCIFSKNWTSQAKYAGAGLDNLIIILALTTIPHLPFFIFYLSLFVNHNIYLK